MHLGKRPRIVLEERLVGGELPWGFYKRNIEFCAPLVDEFEYYYKRWVDTRSEHSDVSLAVLCRFVNFLEKSRELCRRRGMCYECWFCSITQGEGFIEARKNELFILENEMALRVSLQFRQ